jgi:hypothetical protein
MIDVPPSLAFVAGGRLTMVVAGGNRKVSTADATFLTDAGVTRNTGMDIVTFQPSAAFKAVVDFRVPRPCVAGSPRRETDWLLLSCRGDLAFYNHVEERLVLQQCAACTPSNVAELRLPVTLVLRFDDSDDTDEPGWVVEKIVTGE